MRILMVGSEAIPWAKTGGLADVLGALPRALRQLGHDIDVVIPRYRGITAGQPIGRATVALDGRTADAPVLAVETGGVRVMFVDQPDLFDRPGIYGDGVHDYVDNALRFGFFSFAALAWAAGAGRRYDVVHAHDWQAGLVPVLLKTTFERHPVLAGTPVVLTIHNLAYQGTFPAEWLAKLGLAPELMRMDALEFWGRISFLKGGINFSRLITTVSPRYAEEIQNPELGFGFNGILRQRSRDLVGILNGIDYDHWDPERDVHLPAPYSASNLMGKKAAKRAVLEAYRIPVNPTTLARPVIGMVSRMVDQKGLDLLEKAAPELPRLDASFVVLGTGDERYERMWERLAAAHGDRIGVRIGFDEGLAHLIEGGADLFLMPSRFEPCGLNQMYSMRYGTVPVVRATGGLYDTVRNYDPRTGDGLGFRFEEYTPQALLGTLRWALDIYKNRTAWRRIQLAGMREDHSWAARARQYVQVYERAGR